MDEPTPLPFHRSYRVAPGLIAGAYPGSADLVEAKTKLHRLLDYGVTKLISLMEVAEKDHQGRAFTPYEEVLVQLARREGRSLTCERHPIRDGGVTTPVAMQEILDAIDAEIDRGGTVYVHCWGGRGRTGSVVACWLTRKGFSGQGALAELARLTASKPVFLPTPENALQVRFVEDFSLRS